MTRGQSLKGQVERKVTWQYLSFLVSRTGLERTHRTRLHPLESLGLGEGQGLPEDRQQIGDPSQMKPEHRPDLPNPLPLATSLSHLPPAQPPCKVEHGLMCPHPSPLGPTGRGPDGAFPWPQHDSLHAP